MAEPVRVGELLAALPGLAARLAEAQLLGRWPELAGPAVEPELPEQKGESPADLVKLTGTTDLEREPEA